MANAVGRRVRHLGLRQIQRIPHGDGSPRTARLIHASSFHGATARQIHAIACRAEKELGGVLPPDAELLRSFPGVGPKCANLALGVAAGVERISVDVHVWRVVNRWGYVSARTPEKTAEAEAA